MKPYTEWEDYKAGLYQRRNDPDKVLAAQMLLCSADQDLTKAMFDALKAWPNTAKAITAAGITGNPRSWLGQITCGYHCQTTMIETRMAWGLMYPWEQDLADECADRALEKYEREATNGQQALFGTERS